MQKHNLYIFITCLLAFTLACGSAYAASGPVFSTEIEQTRGFKGQVSKDMATNAASSAARIVGLDLAARELARLEELRLLLGSDAMTVFPRPAPAGLALALARESVVKANASGFPPDMNVHVRLRFTVGGRGDIVAEIAELLKYPLQLEYYTRVAAQELEALKAYDEAAAVFLQPGTVNTGINTAAHIKLATTAAAFKAVRDYIALLPQLRNFEQSIAGGAVQSEDGIILLNRYFDTVAEISNAAPDNYLVLTDFAFLHILKGNAAAARECADKAIALNADFAPPYNLRGLVLLWQELPALAVADFTRAINKAPYYAQFYENRALTYNVLEERSKMCSDLMQACNLGSCAGFEWAQQENLCK